MCCVGGQRLWRRLLWQHLHCILQEETAEARGRTEKTELKRFSNVTRLKALDISRYFCNNCLNSHRNSDVTRAILIATVLDQETKPQVA